MSYKRLVMLFNSILLLALATGLASANDSIVSAVKMPLLQPAPIVQESAAVPLPVNENTAHPILYEGARWSRGSAITWSIANRPGTADSPFNGYIESQYEPFVQQAFRAWAAASGLTFKQVSDSNQADIRLGWGDFNTSSTGIVGHTLCQAQSGEFLPGAIIRLENPSQVPLVAGAGNTLTYSGTNAMLHQIILHEIGHALGLADNDDPTSVMYYEATGTNNSLATNDVAGIRALYGAPTAPMAAIRAAVPVLSATSMPPLRHPLGQAPESSNQTPLPTSVRPVSANPLN
jgi:predicted Zn-dependent protease